MNDITALMASMKAAAEKATPGEWWSDVVETDGEYGDGEDRHSGYHSYAVYAGSESLLDMTNSTAACIHEEWDNDYLMAWDETAKRNAEFIAVASPDNVKTLVEALEARDKLLVDSESRVRQQNRHVCELFDENAALRQRIAELESRTVTAAAADVLAERQRQVTAEGWTPEHDDEHSDGEMALAASSYALYAHKKPIAPAIPYNWPWEPEWFKQQGARRDLVKAGALILAEIERLDRAAGIKVIEGEGQ